MSAKKSSRKFKERRDPTAPEADAAEQSRDWKDPASDETPRHFDVDVPINDALDQSRDAPLDDEEHEG